MDKNSEQRLSLVSPALASKVRAAAVALAVHGIELRVVGGLRTFAEQNALFAKGPAFTKARGGYSSHNFGLAVDAVPGLKGVTPPGWAPNWDSPNESPVDREQYEEAVTAMKAQGLAWGGDWVQMKGDYDHFYLADSPATPTDAMRADLAKGLDIVFARCDAGAYRV